MSLRPPEQITMLLENNPYPQDVRVLAEARTLAAAGHSVTVIAPRAAGQSHREHIDGVGVIRFRGFDGSSLGPIGYVLEYLVAAIALHIWVLRMLWAGSTVLHIHNPPDILALAGALFRIAGRKVVFDHHDLFPETVAAKFGDGLAARLAAAGERSTFAVAHHVIATNESFAHIAHTRGRKASATVTVVRNAPPASWMELADRPRPGVLERVELVYVGAISTQDGVEGLAPVLASVRNGHHRLDARLTIVGDGDARPALEAEFKRHGVADWVTFTGWVDLDRVPDLIGRGDICVDPAPPSYVNEHSTMMKVAEYLALGKPVVAYDLLETRRTADGAAMLVTPGDPESFSEAIVCLARDPAERTRLADRALERAESLTWTHSEHALLRAYDCLRAGADHAGLPPPTRAPVSP